MWMTTQEEGAVTVLGVGGRLDGASADGLDGALAGLFAHGRLLLVLDLSCLEYASSAGLRVLAFWLREFGAAGGGLRLAHPTPRVAAVLRLSGFTLIFEVHPSVADAVAACS
jgi:anti-anti-sigma factor